MSTRHTRTEAPKIEKQIKYGLSTAHHNLNEHCDFCVLSFSSRPELKAHVLTHFKKKICLRTQKTLLQIADDWFELHNSHGCTSEQCDSEIISNSVQLVQISEERVKKEENPEENGIDNGGELTNATSSEPMKIESDSETEANFDLDVDASSSENWSASDGKKITTFESRAKKSKVDSTKHTIVSTSTDDKPRTVNRKSVTSKSTHRKSKCRICKCKFAEDEMILHLQSRHVPKIDPIPTCETCGKTFSTRGNLRSHQYLHAERGRYICSYCGKEFVRNANLKEHINLHTGARPFVCEICKKTFHRETLLRNHRRIHTGEKKYRCNIENCERAYMFDIDLKRHKFSVHGIYSKKHPCFICSKVFSENKLLKKHLEAH